MLPQTVLVPGLFDKPLVATFNQGRVRLSICGFGVRVPGGSPLFPQANRDFRPPRAGRSDTLADTLTRGKTALESGLFLTFSDVSG